MKNQFKLAESIQLLFKPKVMNLNGAPQQVNIQGIVQNGVHIYTRVSLYNREIQGITHTRDGFTTTAFV